MSQTHDTSEGTTWERTPGAACRPLPSGYQRRDPEATPLHRAVRLHLETFLEEARLRSAHGFGLPRFVERDFTGYLACGVLARGFARVRCAACRHELLVGFSCKGRGVCPSCTTRRAHDTAAHLTDDVLPAVQLRQWVLTFPRKVRFVLARRPALVGVALAIFLRALATFQRRRARALGVSGASGAITFVQRFGSALQLNVHLHVVVPDGVFAQAEGSEVATFHRVAAPDDDDVRTLLDKTARRVLRVLQRRAAGEDVDTDGALATLEAASLTPGASAGEATRPRRLVAFLEGFSLHAATKVHENDRQGRERLCLYGARGALALSRLQELDDGRFSYHMKRPTPAGATHLVMTGAELLRKLAPLVPAPRLNLTRFHGVFAPNAKLRPLVVKLARGPAAQVLAPLPLPATQRPHPSPYRLDWAALLKRVFGFDVLLCPCGARMRVLAFVTNDGAARRILRHLGLPDAPLPRERARGPPQTAFDWSPP